MSYIGKLIGFLLGLILLRHPVGALLGTAMGHAYDLGLLRLSSFAPTPPRPFIMPLFALAGAISKADGRVSEQEINATEQLMARLKLDPAMCRVAIERFTEGKQPEFSVNWAIGDLKTWCGGRRDLAFMLVDLLLDVAYAEGMLVEPKLTILNRLCWALGVREQELAALAAMKGYVATAEGVAINGGLLADHDPYALLGLTREASEREIKRAYRKLMSQHHPDKLAAQKIPETMLRSAEERAREINAAYERIKSERGIT